MEKKVTTDKGDFLIVACSKNSKVMTLPGGDRLPAIHIYHKNDNLFWAGHVGTYEFVAFSNSITEDQAKKIVNYDPEIDMYYNDKGSVVTRIYSSAKECFEMLLVSNRLFPSKYWAVISIK